MPAATTVSIHPGLVVRVLGGGALVVVALNIGVHLFAHFTGHDHARGLVPLFDLDLENNIPSSFGALLLLAAASLAGLQARLQHRTHSPQRHRWALLAAVVLAMTLDELVGLHELMTEPMRDVLGAHGGGLLHFAWIVPGAVLLLAFAAAMHGFLRDLAPAVRSRVLWAGVLYFGGAIGVEALSGQYAEIHSTETLFYRAVLVSIEEGLEMAGVIVLVHALLIQLGASRPPLALQFAASSLPDAMPQDAPAPVAASTPRSTTAGGATAHATPRRRLQEP